MIVKCKKTFASPLEVWRSGMTAIRPEADSSNNTSITNEITDFGHRPEDYSGWRGLTLANCLKIADFTSLRGVTGCSGKRLCPRGRIIECFRHQVISDAVP